MTEIRLAQESNRSMKAPDLLSVKAYADKLQQDTNFMCYVLASIGANLRMELVRRGRKINDSTLSLKPFVGCVARIERDRNLLTDLLS